MKSTLNRNNCEIIFVVNKEIIDDSFVFQILEKKYKKRVGLDMKYVKSIQSKEFVKCLIENKFKLFNLKSELIAYLALVLKDGFLKTYINYLDFSENKRELVKRRFLIA